MRPEQGVRRERHWGKRPFAKEAADVFMLPAVGFHPVQTGGEGLFYVLLGDFFLKIGEGALPGFNPFCGLAYRGQGGTGRFSALFGYQEIDFFRKISVFRKYSDRIIYFSVYECFFWRVPL